jgi:hypothetical protein
MPPGNPPSKPSLSKQAACYRALSTRLSLLLDRYLSIPLPIKPTTKITIATTISNDPGEIELYIYTTPFQPLHSNLLKHIPLPTPKTRPPNPPQRQLHNRPRKRRPKVVHPNPKKLPRRHINKDKILPRTRKSLSYSCIR